MSPAPASPAVQTLAGHIYNWLQRSGFPTRQFTAGYDDGPGSPSAVLAWAAPGRVTVGPGIRPSVEAAAARYGTRGRMTKAQIEGVRVMLHEGLHQMRYGRTPEFYRGSDIGTAGGNEEAATEAITQDLLPILTKQLYGQVLPGAKWRGSSYPEHVKQLRQLSTFGSGAGSFTDYDARVWRRSFLHATPEVRQQMADAALAKRAAWGKRTGR